MKITGLGLDFTTGKLLYESVPEEQFADDVYKLIGAKIPRMQLTLQATAPVTTFRGELQKKPSIDLNDPKSAGWTYLLNEKDPQREQIEKSLAPLAEHRTGGSVKPLYFHGEPEDEWPDWLENNYSIMHLDDRRPPHYILIVGSPQQVPFHFQSFLDTFASVGRIDFEDPGQLKTYIDKVIRLEKQAGPACSGEAVIFATDGGFGDPTYFSRLNMAEPLADHIEKKLGFVTRRLMGPDATKKQLLDTLLNTKAPLVYTASHGLGAFNLSVEEQRKLNGAICCQLRPGEQLTLDSLLTVDDIPLDRPFLEGAAFFQFACFGYGTPAQSDYEHWLSDKSVRYGAEDFIAALPKKLIFHPRGPIAYIGHVDTAFLHAFTNPDDPYIADRWHPRIAPFKTAIEDLLAVEPCGRSLEEMNNQYSVGNAFLSNIYNKLKQQPDKWTTDMKARFVNAWIRRNDAMNYYIFGDPAARLRISDQPQPDINALRGLKPR